MGMRSAGRPKAELVLSADERDELMRWSRRAKSAQALVLRARIVLACAEPGATNKQVAEEIRDTNNQTCTLDVKHRFRAVTTATYDGPI